MLDFELENYRKTISQKNDIVLTKGSLIEQIGEANLNWCVRNGLFKPLMGNDLAGIQLDFDYQGAKETFIVYPENEGYLLEPAGFHLAPIKIRDLPEPVFQIKSMDFVKAISVANGFSYKKRMFPLLDGFHYLGFKKVGGQDINLLLYNGHPILDEGRIKSQLKTAQEFEPSSRFIVSLFPIQEKVSLINDLGFVFSPLRSNLLISPDVYQQIGIEEKYIVGQEIYPVLIDHGKGLLYIFGKKITKQGGTILFKYLRDFIVHTQYSPVSYAYFCEHYCKDSNDDPSRVIGERKKEIIKNLKSIFNEGTKEYEFAYSGLFSYEKKAGFLKSNFKSDDIFQWGEISSPNTSPNG